jgi:hypothetical protein
MRAEIWNKSKWIEETKKKNLLNIIQKYYKNVVLIYYNILNTILNRKDLRDCGCLENRILPCIHFLNLGKLTLS